MDDYIQVSLGLQGLEEFFLDCWACKRRLGVWGSPSLGTSSPVLVTLSRVSSTELELHCNNRTIAWTNSSASSSKPSSFSNKLRLSPKVLLALQEKLSSSMPRLRLLDLTFGEIPAISGEWKWPNDAQCLSFFFLFSAVDFPTRQVRGARFYVSSSPPLPPPPPDCGGPEFANPGSECYPAGPQPQASFCAYNGYSYMVPPSLDRPWFLRS